MENLNLYLGDCRSASRVFFMEERQKVKITPAVTEIVNMLQDGPKTADEMAAILSISRNAVIKRIFTARQEGFNIILSGKLYRVASRDRTCPKCGKKLSQYNKTGHCFNYPNCYDMNDS